MYLYVRPPSITPSGALRRVLMLLVLATTAVPLAWAQGSRDGFLVGVSVTRDAARVDSVTRIESYTPRRHLAAPEDWELTLEDRGRRALWRSPVASPWHFAPLLSDDQSVPLTLRFPRLVGMARAVVADADGRTVLAFDLDDGFQLAADQGRTRLLDAVQDNRERLVAARTSPQVKRQSAAGHTDLSRFRYEHLPEEQRRRLSTLLAEDQEMLARWGEKGARMRRQHHLSPEMLDRRFVLEPRRLAKLAAGPLATKDGAFTLSGTVVDVDTGLPVSGAVLRFYQYDENGDFQAYLGSVTTGASGTYSKAVDVGSISIYLWEVLDGGYLSEWYFNIGIAGDTTFDIQAVPAVTLSGTVYDDLGSPVDDVSVTVRRVDNSRVYGTRTDATGTYSLQVPRDQPLIVSTYALPPYLPSDPIEVTLSSDTTLDLTFEVGWLVSGRVTDAAGASLEYAGVVVRHVNATTSRGYLNYTSTEFDGTYLTVVPRDLAPASFVVSVYESSYVRQSRGLLITGDVVADFVLEEGVAVSGSVRDDQGAGVWPASVWAYQGETLITSARTLSDGSYQMALVPGLYNLRVEPWGLYPGQSGSTLAPADSGPVEVTAGAPATVDFTLPPATGTLELRLRYPSQEAYELAGPSVRFEILRDDSVVRTALGGDVIFDGGSTWLYRTLYLEPDAYEIKIFAVGSDPLIVHGSATAAGAVVSVELPEPYVWSGVLRDFAGDPLPRLYIISYGPLTRSSSFDISGPDGSFAIPTTPGGFVKFYSPEDSDAILHTERFGSPVENRDQDLTLDRFPPFTDDGTELTQMFGVEDRSNRYNIVVIGDGFTDVTETYTDLNGNCVWDGVISYDLNGNGVWDSGERYALYGEAQSPELGTDPTLDNEPFTDLNGDQFPNLDDQAVFDRNSLEVIRSMFGQDFWNSNRDVFNVFRIRAISNQAGHDIQDADGHTVHQRDTLFGTRLYNPSRGYLFRGNYSFIREFVNEHLPEWDTIIIVVNQPIRMGRANSFIYMYGGPLTRQANNYVIAHEMGHNVGGLSDEYTEYQESYSGPEPTARNVTTMTERDLIPWADLIAEDKEIPSVQGSSGVGLFEGAFYRTGGVFRPAASCMMISANRYCPVCTRELGYRVAAIMGGPGGVASPLSPVGEAGDRQPVFEWAPVADAAHYQIELRPAGGEVMLTLDVYDTSFQLDFELEAGQSYEWRVRAGVEDSWGAWSAWFGFTVELGDAVFLSGSSGLIVPGFEVEVGDPTGPTTFFAVRNTSDAQISAEVAYHSERAGAEPLRTDVFVLEPQQTLTRNVRDNLADLDVAGGFARGLITITEAGGTTATNLEGDYFRLDPGNAFATGDRLQRASDLCLKQEIRFVDFGSGSELRILVDQPQGSDLSSFSYTAYNEAGEMIAGDDFFTSDHLTTIDVPALGITNSFGTVVFDFTNSGGGFASAKYSAFGVYSVELNSACRD